MHWQQVQLVLPQLTGAAAAAAVAFFAWRRRSARGSEPLGLLALSQDAAIASGSEDRIADVDPAPLPITGLAAPEVVAQPTTPAFARLLDKDGRRCDVTESRASELRARERHMTLLHDITHTALEIQDTEAILEILAGKLGDLSGASGCLLTLWDEETQTPIPAAAHGSLMEMFSSVQSVPGEPTITGFVLQVGQPLVIEDALSAEHLTGRIAEMLPTCSLLALPLIAAGQKLGAAVIAFDRSYHFTPEAVRRGEQAAEHVALAIAKAQLLEEVKVRWRETETLRQAGAVVTESLSLEETLERILAQLERVVPYDSASIQLLREGYLELVGGRGFADPEAVIGLRFPVPGDNPNTAVIQQRKPIILTDAPAAHAPFREPPHAHIRSWLGVPLIVRGKVIGMLAVDSCEPGHFNEQHVRLVISFANQAAIAVENARLFEESQRQIQELSGLYNTALSTSSALEIDVLLRRLYAQVQELMAPDTFVVVLHYAAGEEYQVVLALEEGEPVPGAVGLRKSLDAGGLTGWVMQQRKTLLVDDLETEPLPVEPLHGPRPARSWLGVPLIARDQLLGAISLQSFRPHAFSRADRRFLESLAAQVAIAIENAQLYQRAQHEIAERKRAEETLRQRNRELALLNRAGQVFSSCLELNQVLITVLEEVRGLLDVTACSVWLSDPESKELVCQQSTDPSSETVRGWRLARGQGLVGWVAENGKSLIVPDAKADVRHFTGVDRQTGWKVRSILSVPLRVRENVIGVLQVVDRDPDRFRPADLTSMEPLAVSAAIAIENARLVEGLEAKVAARTAEIRAEKEKTEVILNGVTDAIGMVDRLMRVRYVNPAFTDLTGYPAEEILGQSLHILAAEGLSPREEQVLRRTLESGESWQGEMVARRKDGRTYDAAMTITPMCDADGDLIGYVSSHRDITHEKELDRARTRFITNISHELRTPLTNLRLYVNLLKNGAQSEKARRYLKILEDQTKRLVQLTEDMLEITSLDSGQGATAWESVSLPIIIETITTRFRDRAEASGLTFTATPLAPLLPEVKGDQARLTQAVGELVENALNFTPQGGQVTVQGTVVEEAGHRWVTIAVHDTGPGIPPEEQEAIFDRFYRGSLAESGAIPGTGLGLSIAREIVLAHGGRVSVESQLMIGSTFTLWLPVAG